MFEISYKYTYRKSWNCSRSCTAEELAMWLEHEKQHTKNTVKKIDEKHYIVIIDY